MCFSRGFSLSFEKLADFADFADFDDFEGSRSLADLASYFIARRFRGFRRF